MTEQLASFLEQYGMVMPDISVTSKEMHREMEKGLLGEESSYPMIPAWVSSGGKITENKAVAVIDAGGTNFRSALVHFQNGRCVTENLRSCGMPGIGSPATWEEFLSFTADAIEAFMPMTDRIGFCFSYQAEITPEMDGIVGCIDKEVTIKGCEGKSLGEGLSRELARRGYPGKKVFVLNDTVAVQLGGMALNLTAGFDNGFGQVSGTGTNTCCEIEGKRIKKIPGARDMIVNMESGMYNGLTPSHFDKELDRLSHNPGQKRMEKMTAGVYLGELIHLAGEQAGRDGLLSPACAGVLEKLPRLDSAQADAWANGRFDEALSATEEDRGILQSLSDFVFRRSAHLMCSNLAAMTLLTGAGDGIRSAVYAEGSLVQKNRIYRETLESAIGWEIREKMGRDLSLVVVKDTTLPGAATAALLNG